MQKLRYTILVVLLVFLYIGIALSNDAVIALIVVFTGAFCIFAWGMDYMSLKYGEAWDQVSRRNYSAPVMNEPYGRNEYGVPKRTADGVPVTMPKRL